MSARAETPAGGFADPRVESRAWWEAHRPRFNKALVISGVAAIVGYHVTLSFCDPSLLGPDVELSVFTLLGQLVMLALFVGVANIVYALAGPAESALRPRTPERFRRRLYPFLLVVWVALPWYGPVETAVWCATTPPPPPRQALAPPAAETTLIVRMG